MQLLQHLVNEGDKTTYQTAWQEFFYAPVKVRSLKQVATPEMAVEVLKVGVEWNGAGWNTAKASKRLFELTGVPLVTSDFNQYKNRTPRNMGDLGGRDQEDGAPKPDETNYFVAGICSWYRV